MEPVDIGKLQGSPFWQQVKQLKEEDVDTSMRLFSPSKENAELIGSASGPGYEANSQPSQPQAQPQQSPAPSEPMPKRSQYGYGERQKDWSDLANQTIYRVLVENYDKYSVKVPGFRGRGKYFRANKKEVMKLIWNALNDEVPGHGKSFKDLEYKITYDTSRINAKIQADKLKQNNPKSPWSKKRKLLAPHLLPLEAAMRRESEKRSVKKRGGKLKVLQKKKNAVFPAGKRKRASSVSTDGADGQAVGVSEDSALVAKRTPSENQYSLGLRSAIERSLARLPHIEQQHTSQPPKEARSGGTSISAPISGTVGASATRAVQCSLDHVRRGVEDEPMHEEDNEHDLFTHPYPDRKWPVSTENQELAPEQGPSSSKTQGTSHTETRFKLLGKIKELGRTPDRESCSATELIRLELLEMQKEFQTEWTQLIKEQRGVLQQQKQLLQLQIELAEQQLKNDRGMPRV